MNIPIYEHAPVVSRNQINIEADIETVWNILTNIQGWPSWQASVTSANVMGKIEEGTRFHWKAGGLSFKSSIHTSVGFAKFGWTGTTLGAGAIHNWKFFPKGNTTLVVVEESLHGIFPRLFKGYFQKMLDKGLHTSLLELKAASEKGNS